MSNEAEIRSVAEALQDDFLLHVSDGAYRIEYADSTHTTDGEWRPLLDVQVRRAASSIGTNGHPFFTVQPVSALRGIAPNRGETILDTTTEGNGKKQRGSHAPSLSSEHTKDQFRLRDILAQSLLRTGLLSAVLEPESLRDAMDLSERQAIVLLPDTNALGTGVLHHLLRAFRRGHVWLLPVAASLTQVQEHDRRVRSLVNARKPSNLGAALRSRSLVNPSLALLERCKEHTQVIEVDPQLLRYLRPSGKGTQDPDEGDVIEDRLLVEAIHSALRAMRTRAKRRVVTADVFLSRVLFAEGIETLCVQVPELPARPVNCIRYDALARQFVGATLPQLLWDLALVFATVRLVDASDSTRPPLARLDTYWPSKTAGAWISEKLQVTVQPPSTAPADAFSSAVIPEVSFLSLLQVAAALLEGPGTIGVLRQRLPEESRPSEDVARNAAEILRRASFATVSGATLTATNRLSAFDTALLAGDLDKASEQWRDYQPYAALLELLRNKRRIRVEDLRGKLVPSTDGNPSRKATERFARAPVYLGQAWSRGDYLLDGSQRPNDQLVATTFSLSYDRHAKENFCYLKDILPELCEQLRMSPWALGRELQSIIESGTLLREFDFSHAVGQGRIPRERDKVVSGSLALLDELEVPLDRLNLGARPVFTVSRRAT